MIDQTSFNIMRELRQDGRISNARVARKLGISMATVAKKINAMINQGVMVIKAMPNPAIMGYHCQAFIGLSVDSNKKYAVCDRLVGNMHVNMVTTCYGRFDVLLIVFFHELEMLYAFLKEELPQIDGINQFNIYFILEDKNRDQGMFPRPPAAAQPASSCKSLFIDETDKKIIAALIRNGRPNYADLAGRLGVSKPTISRRINALLKERVIRILAIPNPSKFDYSANAYVLVNTEYTRINQVYNGLCEFPEAHLVMKLVNDYEILLGVYAADLDALYGFLENNVGTMDGVKKLETFLCGRFFHFNAAVVFRNDF